MWTQDTTSHRVSFNLAIKFNSDRYERLQKRALPTAYLEFSLEQPKKKATKTLSLYNVNNEIYQGIFRMISMLWLYKVPMATWIL